MNVSDYYDWRAADRYYNEQVAFEWHNGMFIAELPFNYKWEIERAIREYLVNEEGMEEESEELEDAVENAMDGRLWDIEDYIDLEEILGEE